ncbi:catechol 1,2-dioxygenase [Amycolatopsis sulphurea]|uniref:Catechol 1,2-dioxygenase n=1 Tax=Amycolatopsis sulphurea TaxID=76022 RepID=A0A2A9FEL8_9PSEU|nr:dioxygenase [Amycolatopsis sulphurea]PFG49191.1 catechol 1,2-dioxygenase [Amycolatopsis sulphurea]
MTNDRVLTVVEDLERTLVEFIRKHGITHAEYRAATDLIIAEVEAGEASLLFDVFLEAAATDMDNHGRTGSIEAIEGPFYLPGAPWLEGPPYVMPQRPDEAGVPLIFHGRVTSETGRPLAEVEFDLWHADAAGQYSQIHPNIPDWNLRGRFRSDANGVFSVRTIAPPPYEIPKNGPTGTVLDALGRHFFRPAHLHVKLRHEYFGERTSQLYFPGGEYLDSDVANAVRDELVLDVTFVEGAAAADGKSSVDARYDFAFAPAVSDA